MCKVREILDTKRRVELNKEASQIAVPADKAKNSVPRSPKRILSGTGEDL